MTATPYRILIIDDIPSNIKVLKNVLKDDYKLTIATNGLMGLERAASDEPPDIILLDIMMPDIDGYEVLRRLKENEKTSGIPVIFITARDAEDDETKGLALGAVDYITKPISPAIVQARIKTHIGIKKVLDDISLERAALAARVEELESAKNKINTLERIVPICCYCKSVRNDQNYWDQVESFVQTQVNLEFSYSVCPDCFEKHVKPLKKIQK